MGGLLVINQNKIVVGRQKLKKEIDQLCNTVDNNILLVKGESGVGKSFSIDQTLKMHSELKVITCKENQQYINEFTIIRILIDILQEKSMKQ